MLPVIVAAPSSPAAASAAASTTTRAEPRFPLRAAPNRRYLVDRRGEPFLIVGDSPQALIGNLSLKRRCRLPGRSTEGRGSTRLWVDLLCGRTAGLPARRRDVRRIKPFVTPGDLSTPNPAYFARADSMIRLAARHGIVVFLDPIETGGWLGVLRKNGIAKDGAYGRFLGTPVQAVREHRVVERQRLPDVAKEARTMPPSSPSRAGSGRPTRTTSRRWS